VSESIPQRPPRQRILPPVNRRLRVFALDPGLGTSFDTALLNEMTLQVPWEPDLQPGPAGDYIEIIDIDHDGTVHEPVDLNQRELLAQDGLTPSDGNLQFHQQMVYAVAMRTIQNFERALGRVAQWPMASGVAPKFDALWELDEPSTTANNAPKLTYQRRLKIYPHVPGMANLHYKDGGIFCGYFKANDDSPIAGRQVFLALSQDTLAHEIAHPLIMGMSFNIADTSLEDEYAIHEGFADMIAFLQHFWPSHVLVEQIRQVRGDLTQKSLLGPIASQFALAYNMRDGLRNPIGRTDEDGNWIPHSPDPKLFETERGPHDKGAVFTRAVFEAFRSIYESRIADLRRIASRGSGILGEGNLHPDLVDRFAGEASKTARHLLDMCIRALDYMPPCNINVGDFLRALLTADFDLEPRDEHNYRAAFVDAFLSYGLYPKDVGTFSVDTLLWPAPHPDEAGLLVPFIQEFARTNSYWSLPRDRKAQWDVLEEQRLKLQRFLAKTKATLGPVKLSRPFKVIAFLPRERAGSSGDISSQWVVKIVQPSSDSAAHRRHGVTLLVNAETGRIRRIVARDRLVKSKADDSKTLAPLPPPPARPRPSSRQLRVFAFDPSLGYQLETAGINEVTLSVPWERSPDGTDLLQPGPVGEYLEVVDRDPASEAFYEPVDLSDPFILAQDGLQPSEASPQFHQQMVYAVAMRTIRTFERALGRLTLWSPRLLSSGGRDIDEAYVQRLRLYPHALREANAYYSPDKKSILFGYFPAPVDGDAGDLAGQTIFTCLSHDIIAHEVTHALLDGMHRRFTEDSNPDVLAFHEAFADIVALFQHFSLPDVLRHQIARTRGDLESQNQLGDLAQQFGQAIGNRGALRSALGRVNDETGVWEPLDPDPSAYQTVMEPHDRGAILVAAVFDAFLTLYKSNVADLLRIATEGTGVLPAGQIHPDLVNRLSDEAAKAAQRVLDMCIRALDYCPPVDLTFGDYLRAIITADYDYDPLDETHRRVAFVEAFRRHGIVPPDVRTFSVEGLLWRTPSDAPDLNADLMLNTVRSLAGDITSWSLSKSREQLFHLSRDKQAALHDEIQQIRNERPDAVDGLLPFRRFEVHSIRPSIRTDMQGKPGFQWVIELTQRKRQYREPRRRVGAFYFRGGCTLIVDAETGRVRYTINKRMDDARKALQLRYQLEGRSASLAALYFGGASGGDEPFAMLHRL
jgi:hypothetical protein